MYVAVTQLEKKLKYVSNFVAQCIEIKTTTRRMCKKIASTVIVTFGPQEVRMKGKEKQQNQNFND